MANMCAACGGKKEEHGEGKTQHVYTETPGQLMTHDQQKKAQSQAPQPMAIRLPVANDQNNYGRLVEVLLEKNLISPQEALYIAGMAPKPQPQFADPARLF